MKRFLLALFVTSLALWVGCAQPTASSSSSSDSAAQQPPSSSLIDEALTAGAGAELPTTSSTPASQPATEQVPAAVGVGKSSQRFDQYQSDSVQKIVSTPAREYFRVSERITFDRIKHDLELYKAMHDGKGPQSHEEFMREIVEPAQIELPELPPGQRYVYNPETEELMVERPVAQ
jgi:hypothetical protein